MLLLSSPRNGHQRRASLLLLAAVLLYVVPVSASLPAASKCPPHIDCAKEGRHLCKPGSSHCGPCLSTLEENEEGRCVGKKKHHQHVFGQQQRSVAQITNPDSQLTNRYGKMTFYPDLDEEIDYLHSIIEKQEVSEMKPIAKQSKHPAADITSQTDGKNSKTYASQNKSQDRLSSVTVAPHSEVSALTTPTPQPRITRVDDRAGPIAIPTSRNDRIIVILISVCVAVGTVAVILATVCYIKLQKESRLAEKVDYPAFGGAGVPAATATGTSMGDKTLAQSAQMYHYQHQKQQMLSIGNHKPEQKVLDPEVTSDEEEVGGDFTVYECPGLAPTGEMEVKNPLFDDSTIHYQGNNK